MKFRLNFDILDNNMHVTRKKSCLVHYVEYNHDIQINCILISKYICKIKINYGLNSKEHKII